MVDIKSNEKPERATTGNEKQRKAGKGTEERQKAKTDIGAEKTKTSSKRQKSPNGNQAQVIMKPKGDILASVSFCPFAGA